MTFISQNSRIATFSYVRFANALTFLVFSIILSLFISLSLCVSLSISLSLFVFFSHLDWWLGMRVWLYWALGVVSVCLWVCVRVFLVRMVVTVKYTVCKTMPLVQIMRISIHHMRCAPHSLSLELSLYLSINLVHLNCISSTIQLILLNNLSLLCLLFTRIMLY